MIYEFKLPDVGEGIAEGEIVKWYVNPGDNVDEDQIIAEVQTDKAVVEITSPVAGTVETLCAAEGEVVPVDTVMITFQTEQATQAAPAPTNEDKPETKPEATPETSASAAPNRHGRVLAAPSVRRIARELNIDLGTVTGSGPNGRVMKEDVLKHSEQSEAQAGQATVDTTPATGTVDIPVPAAPKPSPSESDERIPLKGIRKVIAKHMRQSKLTAAHCSIVEEIDVTELVAIRKQLSEQLKPQGVHMTYLPFVVKAVVSALKAYPYLNAEIDEEKEEIWLKKDYNIGIAVDTSHGLTVPVIKGADAKSLTQLAHDVSAFAEKARNNRLTQADLSDGTFTVTNIGSTGIGIYGTPIINYPQVAILGTHRIRKMPVVGADNEIRVRDMMGVSLSFDHRLIDGAMASYFLGHFIERIQHPYLLLAEI